MGWTLERSPSPRRLIPRAYTYLYAAIAVLFFFGLFVYAPLPDRYDDHRNAVVEHVKDVTLETIPLDRPADGPVDVPVDQSVDPFVDAPEKSYYAGQPYPTFESVQSTYAYATFLAGPSDPELVDDVHRDKYFIATRILSYQLLHAPQTRTQNHHPFIVLVTDDVPEHKRDRLRRDGAIVWEAPALDAGWVRTDISTWQKVLSKLRLWQLTQFERIAFLDGDTVLTTSLDGIFEDRAVIERVTNDNADAIPADESRLPFSYVLAGVPEMNAAHHFPPTDEQNDWPNIDYLNAGFFVLKPSLELMQYYTTLTTIPERFDPHLPEQNLLNYAHRREGNMPWVQLDTKWNMHYPTVDDLEGGVASLHEKWWDPVNKDLKPFLQSWRWRMEGYWEARDASLV